ncbi:MAG: alpha/beta fold hydrolase [Myxococcales bacterium]|nr:alpha/beta fold hydrolase [Myxococcales bacterium]
MTWQQLPQSVREHYPWAGADLTLSSGHRLHYVDTGQPDDPSGSPLIMVHGNPTWSFYWRTLIRAFEPQRRCIAVDHLGAGLSDKPRDWSYRLQDHIDNLVQLVDHLDLPRFTMVVHDWGGPIGLGAAVARSERVERLVIFNTSVFMEEVPLEIRACRWPGVGEAVIGGLNGFLRVGLFRALADRKRLRNGVAQGYLAPYRRYRDRLGHLRFIRDIPIEEGHPTRATVQRLTEEVPAAFADTPTLILWGDRDFVFKPRFVERWRQLLPHAQVHHYADAAHWVVEDAHERIVQDMGAFLDEHH